MKYGRTWLSGALVTALLLLTACTAARETSSLLLGGDVMLARAGYPIFSDASPWGDVDSFLADNKEVLFAVNLESPIGDNSAVGDMTNASMNLCANTSELSVLSEVGINLVTIANNHTSDCPGADATDTLEAVDNTDITALAENEMIFLKAENRVIAFLALNTYADAIDLEKVRISIAQARDESDFVVVSIHWGNEYQAGPTQAQVELAQELVDAGADLVWGHHPHVLQRFEWIESNVDDHRGLVMYSLGNLLSDQWMLPDALRTVLVQIEFVEDEITGIRVLPLLMEIDGLHQVSDGEEMTLITRRLGLDGLTGGGVQVDVVGE